MTGFLRTYIEDIRGSILPLTTLLLPVMLGMTGLGIDAGMWMMERRDLQTAADAAVLAAAWEIAHDYDDYAEQAALREAQNNGFDPGANGELDIGISTDAQGRTVVTASLSQEAAVYFSRIIFDGDIYTAAAAASAVLDPHGDFCFLSLDEEADGAFTAVGNVEIDSAGCGIAVNSDSDTALDLTGNVDITIKDLQIAGDMDVGNNVDLEYDTLQTGASRIPDPYEYLDVPDYSGCNETDHSVTGDASFDANGGVMVFCGGLDISGNGTVEFAPGVYIIDGGDFSVSGNGALIGEGVSFILTSSSEDDYGRVDITGGKEVVITAPEEGEDMEGVAFYQDRNAPEAANSCNRLLGNSSIELQGAAYFPSNCFEIGGTSGSSSSQTDPCTRIIASTIKLHGTPDIGNNCAGTGVEDIGWYSVRLIK